MDQFILPLYGKVFHPEHANDNQPATIIQICDGIYQKKSTRSDIYYPTLRQLGGIDVTERKFYRGQRFHRKIIQQHNDNVMLISYHNNPEQYTYKPLTILCRELGHTDEFIEEMTNVISRSLIDKKYNVDGDAF
jgi:hypothetical protein